VDWALCGGRHFGPFRTPFGRRTGTGLQPKQPSDGVSDREDYGKVFYPANQCPQISIVIQPNDLFWSMSDIAMLQQLRDR
jgi:hypothetical protein